MCLFGWVRGDDDEKREGNNSCSTLWNLAMPRACTNSHVSSSEEIKDFRSASPSQKEREREQERNKTVEKQGHFSTNYIFYTLRIMCPLERGGLSSTIVGFTKILA